MGSEVEHTHQETKKLSPEIEAKRQSSQSRIAMLCEVFDDLVGPAMCVYDGCKYRHCCSKGRKRRKEHEDSYYQPPKMCRLCPAPAPEDRPVSSVPHEDKETNEDPFGQTRLSSALKRNPFVQTRTLARTPSPAPEETAVVQSIRPMVRSPPPISSSKGNPEKLPALQRDPFVQTRTLARTPPPAPEETAVVHSPPPISSSKGNPEKLSALQRDPFVQTRTLARNPPPALEHQMFVKLLKSKLAKRLARNPPWISSAINVEKERIRRKEDTLTTPVPLLGLATVADLDTLPLLPVASTLGLNAQKLDAESIDISAAQLSQLQADQIRGATGNSTKDECQSDIHAEVVCTPSPVTMPQIKSAASSQVLTISHNSRIPVPIRSEKNNEATSKKIRSRLPIPLRCYRSNTSAIGPKINSARTSQDGRDRNRATTIPKRGRTGTRIPVWKKVISPPKMKPSRLPVCPENYKRKEYATSSIKGKRSRIPVALRETKKNLKPQRRPSLIPVPLKKSK